jgi:hypothetical protein
MRADDQVMVAAQEGRRSGEPEAQVAQRAPGAGSGFHPPPFWAQLAGGGHRPARCASRRTRRRERGAATVGVPDPGRGEVQRRVITMGSTPMR